MVRLLVRTLIALVANAVGLIVAALVLDDVQLDATSFVVAVVIFTIVFAAAFSGRPVPPHGLGA